MTFANVRGALVFDGCLESPMAFDTLFHFIARPGCTLVLAIALVAYLCILRALESISNLSEICICAAWLRTLAATVGLGRRGKPVWQLYVSVRLEECCHCWVRAIDILLISWTMQ